LRQSWDEARLMEVGSTEHDFQEFKGSAYLSGGERIAGDFTVRMSKQVSAFANGAGGILIIGVDDQGQIDGGVPVELKRGGLRSWLEDIVPNLVDPPLRKTNVYEVRHTPGGAILPEHAVYVVEVPSSDDAPHQAMDHRYYLRIAGKSRPMSHLHVEDVRRRARQPRVTLSRVSPFGAPFRDPGDFRGPKAIMCYQATLVNMGASLAHHVGVSLTVPREFVTRDARLRAVDDHSVELTQTPGDVSFFHYRPTPLFPGQEVQSLKVYITVHKRNLDRFRQATMGWRVYADDARPVEGVVHLYNFRAAHAAAKWVASH